MSRKKYKSDRTTTAIRVTKTRFKQVKAIAKRDRQTMFTATDKIIENGLLAKAMAPSEVKF